MQFLIKPHVGFKLPNVFKRNFELKSVLPEVTNPQIILNNTKLYKEILLRKPFEATKIMQEN